MARRKALLVTWASLALGAGACAVPVAVDLDERQCEDAVSSLAAGGIAADRDRTPGGDGCTVEVGRADARRALSILAATPRAGAERGAPGASTLEALVPSRAAEVDRRLGATAAAL